MKKHLALVLALVMVLSSFSFVSAAPDFSDLDGHENAEAVARLELLNVLKGYPDGTFKPDNTITRAEFAAVAVRVSGLENVAMAAKGLPTGFSDVPAWHWASGYVGTAAKMGIVNGIGNGLFAPETPVKYEEAITMIVRALGYEPMAQARGGYPFGYLIVANEIDLLEDAMGVQGTWATRAFVAQITDNALEIPMMIQVGFGTDTKWVVSGEEDTKEKWLLDQMGFATVEGRITSTDKDDLEIYIDAEERDDRGTYDVAEAFDFFAFEGVKVKAWVDGDMVILAKAQEDVYFDATEIDGDELELVGAEKDYDISDDVNVDPFDADFAKVVIDEENEVIWFEGYTWEDFLVIEEVDDYDVYAYGVELDVEDYTLVMDGKTITVEDLEEGDILYYNDGDEFAEVYNESVVGDIGRIYEESFVVDGDEFDYANPIFGQVQYIEDEDMEDFDKDVADKMKDAEEEVEVFLDRYGEAVFVVGDLGEGVTTSMYAYVIEDVVEVTGRRDSKWAFDVVTDAGEAISEDLSDSVDLYDVDGETELTWADDILSIGDVVELVVDVDGEIEEVWLLDYEAMDVTFETDDTYVEGFRLLSTAVVFDVEDFDDADPDADDVIVATVSDADFDEVLSGDIYVNDRAQVIIVVAHETDKDADTTKYDAVVVGTPSKLRGENTWRVALNIDGTKTDYFTEEDAFTAFDYAKGDFIVVELNDDNDEIVGIEDITADEYAAGLASNLVLRDRTLEIDEELYRLVDAVVIDATDSYKVKSFRDIVAGDELELFLAAPNSSFVKYALIVADAADDNGDDEPVDLNMSVSADKDGINLVGLDGEMTYFLQHGEDLMPVTVDAEGESFVAFTFEEGTKAYEFDLLDAEANVLLTKTFIVTVVPAP